LFDTIIRKMPIRAGVSYGEMEADREKGIYVGKALVNAYEFEQEQEWIGGALTPDAQQVVVGRTPAARYDWWLVPFDVPLKGDIRRPCLAINWTQGVHALWRGWQPVPKDHAKKYKNAVDFHDEVCLQCGKSKK